MRAQRTFLSGVIVIVLSGAAASASAQSWRLSGAFLDTWRPALVAAYEWRVPIGRGEPPLPGPETPGPIFADVRDWLLSAQAGGGVTFARVGNADVSPTAMAQLGVLRRLSGALEPRVGVYAFGAVRPVAIGPVVRFEARSAFGAQVGWIWLSRGGGNGPLVTADVTFALLRDLVR
ncbi:MAG: hypothetical protein M3373_12650 [Gemmatimonadota bacterium]|nr:hypothetical protein [Gemmatimonadota bacterium]